MQKTTVAECCLKTTSPEQESDSSCQNESTDCCCQHITTFVAVFQEIKNISDNYFFVVKADYPKYDNSFLSSYLYKPFHPPRYSSILEA